MKDTIFALSTSPGISALAVLRISGPASFIVLKKLIKGKMPFPRVATLKEIFWEDEIIDRCIVICFSEGSSFTGEKVVELQTHGSQAIINKLCTIFSENKCLGLRPAEEGEFTRQAFYNGNLDLTQIEGLSELLKAETESQRRLYFNSFSGGLSKEILVWKDGLIDILKDLEINIDFSDQEIEVGNLVEKTESLLCMMNNQKHMYENVKAVKEGVEVAIIGPPNVGKSTLINALSKRKLSLTSNISGTTRDIIEGRVEIGGVTVSFLDTAGLHKTDDILEKKGISLVRSRIRKVLTRVILVNKESDLKSMGVKVKKSDLIFKAKADKGNKTIYHGISGKNGMGLDVLIGKIESLLPKVNRVSGVISGERQKRKVLEVIKVLEFLVVGLKEGHEIEILAEECRNGVKFLEELTGKIDTEEVLGKIFKNFCIGK